MQPRPLRYMLVTDGSSDACLTYPIEWLLGALGWHQVEGGWADLRAISEPGQMLSDRIRLALDGYPAELLFVHRDAERQALEDRVGEIEAAVEASKRQLVHVCVVPIRMTEAWLLHDETAIRRAAGKPKGKSPLEIPTSIKRFEALADPKQTLKDALMTASETSGRLRKRKLRDFGRMRYRVAELIEDYGPLRTLSAFQRLEQDLQRTLEHLSVE